MYYQVCRHDTKILLPHLRNQTGKYFQTSSRKKTSNDTAVKVSNLMVFNFISANTIAVMLLFGWHEGKVFSSGSFTTVLCVAELWSWSTWTWKVSFFCVCFLGNSYNSEERIVCSGYDNGDIKMFDLKTMSLRWETNVKNGVSKHSLYSYLI